MSELTEQYGPHCIGNIIRIIDEYTILPVLTKVIRLKSIDKSF